MQSNRVVLLLNEGKTMSIRYKTLLGLLLVEFISSCDLLQKAGLTCSRFYDVTTIEKVLTEHSKVVKQIKDINPKFIFVGAQKVEGCPGKAELSITFPTERDRQKIKQLIGDTFFGVRYELLNT